MSANCIAGWHVSSLHVWLVHLFNAFGHGSVLCELCGDVATELDPRCSLATDAVGRFHLDLSASSCSSAAAVESYACAGRVEDENLGAAFIFLDASLMHIAASGGISCFDASVMAEVFNLTGAVVLSAFNRALARMEGLPFSASRPGRPDRTDCLHPIPWAPHGISLARSQLWAWRHEVLNVGKPFWHSSDLLPKVSCLIPLVWPRQKPFLQAICATYGPDCDELRFFISSPVNTVIDMDELPCASKIDVVNLHLFYPIVPVDEDDFHRETGDRPSHDSFNTIIKLLHMLQWAAESSQIHDGSQWWYCRLERDTFFIPENFRLLVVSERLNTLDAHYLGTRQFNEVPRFGLTYNDGGPGVCLSRGALLDLGQLLKGLGSLGSVGFPDFQRCQFATGHREDLMLATCLRQVGIRPSAVTTDAFGREWFSIRPLKALTTHRPPFRPDGQAAQQQAWNFWMGRGHLCLSCARQDIWIVEAPVSFNSFKNTSLFHEAWMLLSLPPAERYKHLGFPLELSGLRRKRRVWTWGTRAGRISNTSV